MAKRTRRASRKSRKSSRKGTRKMNPYMKFAQKTRPEILKQNPHLKSDVVTVAKKIGQKWRSLSDAEKARY